MGVEGKTAGTRTAAAAHDAAESLGRLDEAAGEAANSTGAMGAESEKAAAGLDKRAQLLNQLRQEYNYLSDAQLQVLANERMQLQQNQQRKREQEQQSRQQQSSGSSSGGAVSGRMQVEIVGKSVDANALIKDGRAMDLLSRGVGKHLERLAAIGAFNLNRR